MDWVVNASSLWDMTELDIDDFDVVGNNQNMEVFSADSASVVSGDGIRNKWSEQKQSSKKPRGQVSCLVDECKVDLTACRDYHRRHRVCGTHSKTPVVKVGGNDQRFCQQCSRFHSLGEFDDVKRSCRKRLDGHNKRRRKPKTDPMYLNYGSFFTDHQGLSFHSQYLKLNINGFGIADWSSIIDMYPGTRLLHFGGSPAYTTTFGSWPDNEKLNQKLHVSVEQTTPSNSYARERKFPFLLDNDCDIVNQPYSEASFQQVVNTNASAIEPKSALSLLSKQTIHHHHHHHTESGPSPTDMVQFNGSLYQQSNPHIPLRNVAGTANNYLLGMVQFRTGGLLENGAPQVLSFSWE